MSKQIQFGSADETIQRLLFSLSELQQLGEAILSGYGNFNLSSKMYLRMILGTLQVTRGAILLYYPTEGRLAVEAAINVKDESLTIPLTAAEVEAILGSSVIDCLAPAEPLKPLWSRIQPQLESLGAKFWTPLKIREQFLGVISLGPFFAQTRMEDWTDEVLNLLSNQTSIAIAYSRLLEETRSEKFRLFHLSYTATQICKLLKTEEVVEEVVNHAVSLLDASAGGLLLINPFTQRLEVRSLFAMDPELDPTLQDISIPLKTEQPLHPAMAIVADVVKQGQMQHCSEEKAALFGRRNLLAVPMRGRESILGVLIVADKERRGAGSADFTPEDGVLLEAFANQAGVAIENAQLYQEALEGRRLQAEMEEAAKIQENLIPETQPAIPGYEVFGLYQPRGGVGGDYYDYIQEPDGSWGLAIADVSGKGMQAALLMATLRAGLLSEVTKKNDLPNRALSLNSLLHASGTLGKYATFFYAKLQPETDQMVSINAGHNYPIVMRSNGMCEQLKKGGAPLGMFPDDLLLKISVYEQETSQLYDGDVVIFYTDGVTETLNVHDELYGENRLMELAQRLRRENAEKICTTIYEEVLKFQGEAEQFDDLTLMVLKKK
jgi:sigma-B regulation protein RsbU (phosphoserine phosphatase)